jgi:hypothetical protein
MGKNSLSKNVKNNCNRQKYWRIKVTYETLLKILDLGFRLFRKNTRTLHVNPKIGKKKKINKI